MLTSVELFAGAGGLAMGLALAGFTHRLVAEWNHDACETIRRNQALGFPLVADWPLREIDVRALGRKMSPPAVDLVAGGPPCQPFSLGGRHKAQTDARDMFPAFTAVVQHARPRAFIVENVKGLTRPAFAPYFNYIALRLQRPEVVRRAEESWPDHHRRLRREIAAGRSGGLTYHVTHKVLDAANYGVPQRRERVFLVGFRADLGIDWSFPPETHAREALLAEQWVTRSYWDRHAVPRDQRGEPPRGFSRRATAPRVEERAAWRTVRDALAGLPDPERAPDAAATFPDHRFQPGARFYPGHTGSPPDWPAKALKAGGHGVPGGENALLRPDGSGRYFTVREAARLQTFSDRYRFHGSWSEVMRQLGNAVPVTLGRVMGESVARALRQSATPVWRDVTGDAILAPEAASFTRRSDTPIA